MYNSLILIFTTKLQHLVLHYWLIKGGYIMKIEKINEKIVYNENSISKRLIFNEGKVLNFMLNLKPGQGVPPHTHESSDLVIYIVEGDQGELIADDKTSLVAKGDVIHCYGTEIFSLKNTGNSNMACFCVIAPNPSQIYSKEF